MFTFRQNWQQNMRETKWIFIRREVFRGGVVSPPNTTEFKVLSRVDVELPKNIKGFLSEAERIQIRLKKKFFRDFRQQLISLQPVIINLPQVFCTIRRAILNFALKIYLKQMRTYAKREKKNYFCAFYVVTLLFYIILLLVILDSI